MKILILGSGGMLGSALFRLLPDKEIDVYGTVRQASSTEIYQKSFINTANLFYDVDVLNKRQVSDVLSRLKPDYVVNCVGVIKQLDMSNDPLHVIPINALLPHSLADMANKVGSKLIHISTDCVFDGKKGDYVENDRADAEDLYGRSKQLGEITDKSHVLTLRTSLIGHELRSSYSLVDWFLSQEKTVNGYKKAIFSGFTTVEISNILKKYIFSNRKIHGLYHLAMNPISKFELLKLIRDVYRKDIDILADEEIEMNRSLNANKFNSLTGYSPPKWDSAVKALHDYYTRYNRSIDA